MYLTGIAPIEFVIVADPEDRGLLSALKRFHQFLRGI
jgi:hypothetical protein